MVDEETVSKLIKIRTDLFGASFRGNFGLDWNVLTDVDR